MNGAMTAIIRKDFRAVTTNKHLLTGHFGGSDSSYHSNAVDLSVYDSLRSGGDRYSEDA